MAAAAAGLAKVLMLGGAGFLAMKALGGSSASGGTAPPGPATPPGPSTGDPNNPLASWTSVTAAQLSAEAMTAPSYVQQFIVPTLTYNRDPGELAQAAGAWANPQQVPGMDPSKTYTFPFSARVAADLAKFIFGQMQARVPNVQGWSYNPGGGTVLGDGNWSGIYTHDPSWNWAAAYPDRIRRVLTPTSQGRRAGRCPGGWCQWGRQDRRAAAVVEPRARPDRARSLPDRRAPRADPRRLRRRRRSRHPKVSGSRKAAG